MLRQLLQDVEVDAGSQGEWAAVKAPSRHPGSRFSCSKVQTVSESADKACLVHAAAAKLELRERVWQCCASVQDLPRPPSEYGSTPSDETKFMFMAQRKGLSRHGHQGPY